MIARFRHPDRRCRPFPPVRSTNRGKSPYNQRLSRIWAMFGRPGRAPVERNSQWKSATIPAERCPVRAPVWPAMASVVASAVPQAVPQEVATGRQVLPWRRASSAVRASSTWRHINQQCVF
jgi:hypothetical protein